MVMLSKFGNFSISMREFIMTSILKGVDTEKPVFSSGGLGSSAISW